MALMSYMHIKNLYVDDSVVRLFRQFYALEKIHGTSAHVAWAHNEGLSFFSGGAAYDAFAKCFCHEALRENFGRLGHDHVCVFGEAYGGKLQGMSATYGPVLRFVAFEVRIGDLWLSVPAAADVTRKLGLEFVHYEIAAGIEGADRCRDADSVQAIRNGLGDGHMREGIVLRPLIELHDSIGARLIAKHKRVEFAETRTPRKVGAPSPELLDAQAVANEWVTSMRLEHVLDHLRSTQSLSAETLLRPQNTKQVIDIMLADIERESAGELEITHTVRAAIGKATAKLFLAQLREITRVV